MTHKTGTIVSVAVRRKFTIGETYYFATHYDTEQVTITALPYWKPFNFGGGCWKIDTESKYGKHSHSLGDLGVIGYAYDGCPEGLVKNNVDIEARRQEYRAWHENFYRNDTVDEDNFLNLDDFSDYTLEELHQL